MRCKNWVAIIFMTLGAAAAFSDAALSASPEAPRITKEELRAMMGNQDLLILDARTSHDWNASREKISGAVRFEPADFNSVTAGLSKDKTIVIYCAWVDEATSARLAHELYAIGYKKVYALKGGWREWSREHYPVEPK